MEVGKYPLRRIYSKDSLEPLSLTIRQSSVVLHLSLSAVEASTNCLLLRDGQPVDLLRGPGEVVASQFLLRDDVENHSLVLTVGGRLCLSFNIRVHVFRRWDNNSVPVLSAPKWTEAEITSASIQYFSARAKVARQRSSLENIQARLTAGNSLSGPRLLQLLHDAILACLKLLATMGKSDLVVDYSTSEESDIDIEETLEFLRAHPTTLRKAANGPVVFEGQRYTPAHVIPRTAKTGKLDLRVPLDILAHAQELLEQDRALAIFKFLLRELYESVLRFNDAGRTPARDEAIAEWLSRTPQSLGARALKARIIEIWRLCGKLSALEENSSAPARVLRDGFRDFDLFEWAVFSGVCTSFGFVGPQTALLGASVDCGSSVIVNTNAPGGGALVSALLPGWRDSSSFASGFRPDLIVHFERRVPIPIDAKFRVADGLNDPCSADSLKEVQAYLNEFGCYGAVVVVPLIPATLTSGPECQAVRVSGAISGREYRVWIVEYSPLRLGFGAQLEQAILDIASLHDFAATVS